MSNLPKNINEHCPAIKSTFFSGASQVVGHVARGRYKILLTAEL